MRFEDFYCQDMTTSKVIDLSSDDDYEQETMQQDISFFGVSSSPLIKAPLLLILIITN